MSVFPRSSGFTLVELAIALMIIGLLIAGVLKGQELITNARITQTLRQLDAYRTAVVSFASIYNALPGDMKNVDKRIPNCSALPCSTSGNGNGIVGITDPQGFDNVSITLTSENRTFWLHLAKANLTSGISLGYTGTPNTPGIDYPTTPFGGSFQIDHQDKVYAPDVNAGTRRGHFIVSVVEVGKSPGPATYHVLKCSAIAQMDRKADDGLPRSGDIRATTLRTDIHCLIDQGGNNYIYDETDDAKTSNIAYLLED